MEWTARRNSGQGLDVSALDLPRCLPDLALPDHRACVWTEGDATAAARLKVHHGHAQIVRVAHYFNLQVNPLAATLRDDVCTKPASEVGNLIRVCHRCYLPATERRREGGHAVLKVVVAHFPVHTAHFEPAALVFFCQQLWLEGAFTLQLQAMKSPAAQLAPGPQVRAAQLAQQLAGGVHRAQAVYIQHDRQDVVGSSAELCKAKLRHIRDLHRGARAADGVKRPRSLEGAMVLESALHGR
mmetsp:Transcript_126147/g.299556  ORF Transcript_126147/g.299556 Transcript_126147/m.299556 type:complete len:241 (-) Transcript_126147:11-733(-)